MMIPATLAFCVLAIIGSIAGAMQGFSPLSTRARARDGRQWCQNAIQWLLLITLPSLLLICLIYRFVPAESL